MPLDTTLQTFDTVFSQAGDAAKYLLLGNGFSIAVKPDIFNYESLYESADFSGMEEVKEIFKALNTRDFEEVIRALINTAKLLRTYEEVDEELVQKTESNAEKLKGILVKAVAEHHPERPSEITDKQYQSCRSFLSKFKCLYTLNYDVLLYWTLMQDEVDELELPMDDGFRNPDDAGAPYVSWQEGHKAQVHYLHGALHLFDAGHEIVKYTWSRTEVPIVQQVRAALDEEKYPIFVAEGESDSKLERIMHSAYLHKALRSFDSICGSSPNASLFIYGHSLDDTDNHILKKVAEGKIKNLFIGTRGDMTSAKNVRRTSKAQELVNIRESNRPKYPLNIQFYDSASVKVWE